MTRQGLQFPRAAGSSAQRGACCAALRCAAMLARDSFRILRDPSAFRSFSVGAGLDGSAALPRGCAPNRIRSRFAGGSAIAGLCL